MDDEVIAAIEDFSLALHSEGPSQACNTLRSYSVELTGASTEAFQKILQIYCSYLEQPPPSENNGAWAGRFEAKNFLTTFLESHPIFTAQLQRSWQQSLGSVILNADNVSLDDHLAKIKALEAFLPEALSAAAARVGQASYPCSDQTLRTLIQTALFSTSLTPQNPHLDHDLEKILELSFASFLQSATTPLALVSLMQICFEAALDTIQAPATVHAIAQLDSESAKIYWKKAWDLLKSLQKINSTACDIFWGAYAASVCQLAPLISRHGRDHLGFSSVVKLLCNSDSAGMMLQCLLANPESSSAATATKAGNPPLKSIKSAFKTALVLLRDFPEAFVSACCDILTPAANAILATRIEALNGK
jgi:hypothetical protein